VHDRQVNTIDQPRRDVNGVVDRKPTADAHAGACWLGSGSALLAGGSTARVSDRRPLPGRALADVTTSVADTHDPEWLLTAVHQVAQCHGCREHLAAMFVLEDEREVASTCLEFSVSLGRVEELPIIRPTACEAFLRSNAPDRRATQPRGADDLESPSIWVGVAITARTQDRRIVCAPRTGRSVRRSTGAPATRVVARAHEAPRAGSPNRSA
jgi:hypothetical protein